MIPGTITRNASDNSPRKQEGCESGKPIEDKLRQSAADSTAANLDAPLSRRAWMESLVPKLGEGLVKGLRLRNRVDDVLSKDNLEKWLPNKK